MGTPDLSTLLPRHLAERAVSGRAALEGERKLVTVLFADLVGSTALASEMDPEDLVDLLNGLFSKWVEAVHRYEGTVDKFLGDGMLALFGAPLVHEDDPRRAALAALEIRDATRDFAAASGHPIQARIGLNTGTVVVGTVGSDARMEYTAIGDAVNVAQRVEAAADPGAVFVSSATARLIELYVELRPAGQFTLKGKTEPESLFEVIAHAGSIGSVRTAAGLTSDLVGRESELGQLVAGLDRLRSGAGSVIAIVGEAGLGKSRLLAEMRTQASGLRWLQGQAVSFGSATPYLPIADAVAELASASADPDLQALVRADRDPSDAGLRDRLMSAVRRALLDAAPVVLAIEDIHWADTASRDVLFALSNAVSDHPVLLVVTGRPEAVATAAGLGAELVELAPLPLAEREQLIGNMLEADAVPDVLERLVAERAGGNPFFTQELIRALVDAGALTRINGTWQVAAAAASVELPATVQGVVAARLDRLPEAARRTLQAAAVLGQTFDFGLLRHLVAEPAALEPLIGSGFLTGSARAGTYAFGHAITRDVAYETCLKRERRDFHRRAAAAIEAAAGQDLIARAAELGRHFDLAGEPERAVPYLAEAARQSAAAYANDAALEMSARVLDLASDTGLRFEMLQLRSKVLGFVGRHEEERSTIEQMRELAGEDPFRDLVCDEAAIRAAIGSGFLEAYGMCEEALAKAEELGAPVLRGRLLLQWATMQLRQYSPTRAVAPLEEAVALFTEHNEPRLRAEALSRLAGALRLVAPERVAEVTARALEAAEAARDPRLVSSARFRIAAGHLSERRLADAAAGFNETIELAAGIGDATMLIEGHRLAAEAEAGLGRTGQADTHLWTAMRRARAAGNTHGWLFSCMSLIEQWEAQQRLTDMLQLLAELEPQVVSWDEPANLSYIHYAYGYRTLRWLNRLDDAAARLKAALAIVGDSPDWMPPAVMYRNGLAMVRIDQGRLDEAAAVLAEAITLATENQLMEVTGPYLLVSEARLGLASGDLADAEQAIERLEVMAGTDELANGELHAARMLRAELEMETGRPDTAVELARRALSQEPLATSGRWFSHLHAHAIHGRALQASGRDAHDAWAAARQALDRYWASIPPGFHADVRRRPDVAAIRTA